VPFITVRVKTKRRTWWAYAISGIVSLPLNAFLAWVAYSGVKFSLALAWQVFAVFTAISLSFIPLLYIANERQVRDHSSKALVATATVFTASFAAAVLYFIARHEGDIASPLVFGIITIGLSVCLVLYGIRWEFE
jgi:hypothetical protein